MIKNIKVLAVEDDSASLSYLEVILKKEGLDYKTATNGQEGLAVFKEYLPHIVLSDINMSHMNGIELLAAIKKIQPQTIVIMLTAFNSEDYVIESMKYGANNYLKKPIFRENIVSLLRKYKSIINSRNTHKKIFTFITQHSYTMEIGNDIKLIPYIINHLIDSIDAIFKDDETMGIRLGLDEIIINAIEHGNLNITYIEKTNAIKNNTFEKLQNSRMNDPQYINKKVKISFELQKDFCEWIIKDEGKGFNPSLIPNPILTESSDSLHGRGIFITQFQFDEMEYSEGGTKVRLRKNIH